VTVLSVVSDDPRVTEEPFIDAMTEFAGCTTQKVNVSSDPARLFDDLGDACWHNDAPLTAVSSLAHMQLMRLARLRGIKVLLTGQGADEQLGGYNKFFYFYLFGLFRSGRYVEAAKTLAAFARHSDTLSEFRLSEAKRYLSTRWLAKGTFITPAQQHQDSLDIGYNGSYPRREWLDLTVTSVPALLHSEDRMSMSQSLEMRVPFLDYRLVELLARVDPSEKFAGGRTKSIFRAAIEGLVPDAVRLRRDKKGFSVPENRWLRTTVADRFSARFRGDLLSARAGFVDGARLRALYSRFFAGSDAVSGRQFFRAFAFEEFLRRFEPSISI
jgi:asparagine synthase (glutamine-hydrolysing)